MRDDSLFKYIKQFFTSDIFRRGQGYFSGGHVKDVVVEDKTITALVKGSEAFPYKVIIQKNVSGKITSINCTCPYSHHCKHAAAVLLHYVTHGSQPAVKKEISNPLLEPETPLDDRVLEIEKYSDKSSFQGFFDEIDETGKTFNTPMKIKERWKLIFYLCRETRRYYGSIRDDNSLQLSLGLVYLKKDGTQGRCIEFKKEKLTEPIKNEVEQNIFNTLIRKPDFRADSSIYFDILLENRDLPLYTKKYSDFFKTEFIEINQTIIDFNLKAIDYENSTCRFNLKLSFAAGNGYHIDISQRDEPLILLNHMVILTDKGEILYRKSDKIYAKFIEKIFDLSIYHKEDIDILKSFIDKYLKDEVICKFNKNKIITKYLRPKPILEITHSVNKNETVLNLCFKYNDREISSINENKDVVVSYSDYPEEIVVVFRDKQFENRIKEYLSVKKFETIDLTKNYFNNHNFNYLYYQHKHDFYLNIPIKKFLIEYGIPLIDEGYELRFQDKKATLSKGGGKVNITVKSGIDWFDINADYLTDKGDIDNFTLNKEEIIQGLIQIGDNYVILSKEDIKKLTQLLDEGMDEKGRLKISKLNFGVIDSLYKIISNNDIDEIQFAVEISKKLKEFSKIDKNKLPEKFYGTLREYQESGYNWLHFLRKYNLNGCLADDMGLGKTVQTLAFLQNLKETGGLGLSLIIVPVTTVVNWESEMTRFTPKLKFVRHLGQERVKDKDFFNAYDIIISSYHTLRNDIEFFNDFEFDYLILDEAQNIKNHNSLIFKTVRIIKSKHKLSLTGTPIENNTTELWSQFNFLNPSLLGSVNEFKRTFVNPIEANQDKTAAERLRKIIYPFILRRKKEEVAKDLPEKEEIIIYCEMNSEQKIVYNTLREYYKSQIENTLEQQGIEKSAIKIFEALLRLRQAALFPSLVNETYKNIESIKFETLKDLMEEIIQEKHKILLFSQFVQSLKIIENEVKTKKIKYSYIDGQTKKRDVQIKYFQEDDDTKLFLLSLKAGGVGINLTAADYVILFDPWWNPAVESQAVDRSHRIGQTRKVIVYKLIVKETVEEKILELQKKKKELVSQLITEEASFFKSLSKSDIMNLFN